MINLNTAEKQLALMVTVLQTKNQKLMKNCQNQKKQEK